MTRLAFSFFSNIYIFSLDSDLLYISIFELLYTHQQIHAEHNDNDETVILEKYTSHFIEMVVCERGSWRPNRTAIY